MEPNNNPSGGTPPAPAPNNSDPNGNGGTPPAPAPNGDGGNGDGNQPVQLTDEQLQAAFNHPRFKELTQAAQELKKLKDQQSADEAERLKKQGEFETLAQQREQEANEAKAALENERKNNALIVAANKLGAHDASVVAKLVDRGTLTIKDDGTVEGAENALAELQKSNPYLFKTGSTTKMGGGDTNPQGGGNAEFTASQYADAAFYKEHQAEMDKALKENRVDMTR